MVLAHHHQTLEIAFERERPRIVGLCVRISGDVSAGEDLAQETFVEAWRHIHKLHNLDGVSPWLSAIARNVCMRWQSQRGREDNRLVTVQANAGHTDHEIGWPAADDDVELELERADLSELLDRALTMLPPTTRAILIERYIQESPHAEIAARLGMSTGAVKMRLQRGKLALQRVLNEDLCPGASAYGLIDHGDDDWHETSHWCSICGERRLDGYFNPLSGDLALRCPACYPAFALHQTQIHATPSLFGGIERLSDAYEHVVTTASQYFRQALEDNTVRCFYCGGPAALVRTFPPGTRLCTFDWLGIHVHCSACDQSVSGSVSGMILGFPEMQDFRSDHPRLRTLPLRQIEVDGQPAVVIRYQSMTDICTRVIVINRERLTIQRMFDESSAPFVV